MDTISDQIVYKVSFSGLSHSFRSAFSNSLSWHSLTLSLDPNLSKTVLHTCLGTCLHYRIFSTLHWRSAVTMSHSLSWVIFFTYFCTVLHSFLGLLQRFFSQLYLTNVIGHNITVSCTVLQWYTFFLYIFFFTSSYFMFLSVK